MARVVCDKVGKNYGVLNVLKDISFALDEQKFAVLLGPSGCGKTTLLRMVAGLETITSGEIRIDGKRVNEVHARDRNIAMVFQTYALYPQMNVFNNIAFSLQVAKVSKAEIKRQVGEALEILGISAYANRYPRELSGGQRQRVAMGRALVRHPQIFLFDEPLSNLDAKLRVQMRYEIRRIHNQLKTTTIYVTHDQIEAMTMADEIVVMNEGGIEQIGIPEKIYEYPASCFVADFIGSPSINLLKGVVGSENGELVLDIGGVALSLPQTTTAKVGQRVIYGIRPTDIVLDKAKTLGKILTGVVKFMENTGTETHLYLTFNDWDIRIVTTGRWHANVGDILHFSIDIQKIHLFDQATEMRLA